MDGSLTGVLGGLASRFLDQDQDFAFAFQAEAGNFVVVGFSANEQVNAPFEVRIQLASPDSDIDLHALMDTPAALGIFNKYDAPRFLHGIITEVERGDSGVRRTFYSVTLRPMLHRLDFGSDSRIWQNKTVPDIVKEVFADYGIVDVDWRLEGDHQPREYATQHRETHRAYVERLLAEEGIFYFFEHSATAHRMIITDAPLATPMLAAAPVIGYNARSGGQSKGSSISTFNQRQRLRSSSYEMNDYTFKNPPANQKRRHMMQENNGLSNDYALYDYPGRYKDSARVGDGLTKHRMEAVRVDATTGAGSTNNIHMCPGFHFELAGHDDSAANSLHFLLGVSHSGQQTAALEEDAGSAPTTYGASFTTMPGRLPYRAPVPRKPIVDGPQIATVTGPPGEEIYCDEFGRIKVQFPWDRYGKADEYSSCWIRVMHASSGSRYGHATIPRIGSEVVIEYLEGDPDQPMVMGMAYNPSKPHKYDLPENKTRSVWTDKTHKGKGFNEIRFESEKGQEEIFVHAERDFHVGVENDFRTSIAGEEHSQVQGNSTAIVLGEEVSHTVSYRGISSGNSMLIASGNESTVRPLGPSKFVTGAADLRNQEHPRINMGHTRAAANGSLLMHAGGDVMLSSDGETQIQSDKSLRVTSLETLNIVTPADLKLSSQEKVVVEASKGIAVTSPNGIVLQSGAASITLAPDGKININGTIVTVVGDKICLN